jgi:hypothetical protein
MNDELEKLELDDALSQTYSMCEKYGARKVLLEFRKYFPQMFDELAVQMSRMKPEHKVAALLRPHAK